jgi:hypothetical protein
LKLKDSVNETTVANAASNKWMEREGKGTERKDMKRFKSLSEAMGWMSEVGAVGPVGVALESGFHVALAPPGVPLSWGGWPLLEPDPFFESFA